MILNFAFKFLKILVLELHLAPPPYHIPLHITLPYTPHHFTSCRVDTTKKFKVNVTIAYFFKRK